MPNNGYYDQTVLTVATWAGGPAPTTQNPAVWNITANFDLVSFACTDATCASAVFTAQASQAGQNCGENNNKAGIIASIGGRSSDPAYLAVDSPDRLESVGQADNSAETATHDGFFSVIVYQLVSKCNTVMTAAAVNEQFPGPNERNLNVPNNWDFIADNDPGFNHFWQPGAGFDFEVFSDSLIRSDAKVGGTTVPAPQTPGPMRVPPVPLSNAFLTRQRQVFRAGSTAIGTGVVVHTDDQTIYQDHGRNVPYP